MQISMLGENSLDRIQYQKFCVLLYIEEFRDKAAMFIVHNFPFECALMNIKCNASWSGSVESFLF